MKAAHELSKWAIWRPSGVSGIWGSHAAPSLRPLLSPSLALGCPGQSRELASLAREPHRGRGVLPSWGTPTAHWLSTAVNTGFPTTSSFQPQPAAPTFRPVKKLREDPRGQGGFTELRGEGRGSGAAHGYCFPSHPTHVPLPSQATPSLDCPFPGQGDNHCSMLVFLNSTLVPTTVRH